MMIDGTTNKEALAKVKAALEKEDLELIKLNKHLANWQLYDVVETEAGRQGLCVKRNVTIADLYNEYVLHLC